MMSVHMTELNIACDAGRALLGSESHIGAEVSVLDTTTRKVIAERHFREREEGVAFAGNLGILVETAKYVIDAGGNDMLDDAVQRSRRT